MLATTSLIDDVELDTIRGFSSEFADDIDATTECISLSTASFAHMPAEVQECLKKAMEIHLKSFGRLYLAALNIGFDLGSMQGIGKAIEDSLKLLEARLLEVAGK